MKNTFKKAAAVALVAVLSGPALASISTGNLDVDVRSAVGSNGAINIVLQDGVATLSGNAKNRQVAQAAVEAALQNPQVDSVVDMIQAY